MKLHALNERIVDYGFPLEIEDNDQSFHGHSRGILFCMTDTEGNVLETHMPASDNADENLKKLINDSSITKLTQTFFSADKDKGTVVEKVGYYLPYFVVGHSMFQPTLNYDNIIDDGVHENYVDLEVLFTYQGYNRYVTVHISTINVPILTALYESFDNEMSHEFLLSLGCVSHLDDATDEQYTMDFYNELGECQEFGFVYPSDLRDHIVSVRVIGMKWKVKEKND